MNELRCWVTRRYNGLYLVTGFKPVIRVVAGTDHVDAYIKHGDPIGYLNIELPFAMSVFDSVPEEKCVPVKSTMYGCIPDGQRVSHYLYNDECEGLFHIVRSLDISIRYVCPWFVERMFGLTEIVEPQPVIFSGKCLTKSLE